MSGGAEGLLRSTLGMRPRIAAARGWWLGKMIGSELAVQQKCIVGWPGSSTTFSQTPKGSVTKVGMLSCLLCLLVEWVQSTTNSTCLEAQ